ncbi:hypothetical protein JNUCC1_02422 [Lentibacillus sp. JNUCC-1]|nr:hypothetical protein [Lentibacillus sp. JNUCC-1]
MRVAPGGEGLFFGWEEVRHEKLPLARKNRRSWEKTAVQAEKPPLVGENRRSG